MGLASGAARLRLPRHNHADLLRLNHAAWFHVRNCLLEPRKQGANRDMSMKISAVEVGPIAASPLPSFWPDARTPAPPPQPEPYKPLVSAEPSAPAGEPVPGVVFEPSPAVPMTQPTYSITAQPRTGSAEPPTEAKSRRDASAIYEMVADFADRP